MNKAKQGVSVREIARRWVCSASYVSQFLKRAGLDPLLDGSYDLAEATRRRENYTIIGRGKRKWDRRHPATVVSPSPGTTSAPVCQGCGDRYVQAYSRNLATPDPTRFCSASCQQDVKDGFTPKEIARRRERGIPNANPAYGEAPEWKPPAKPAPIVRTCSGCGGRYDVRDAHCDEPEIYCHTTCQRYIREGVTRAEIRRHLRTQSAEDGDYTRAELTSEGFFDHVNADGTPKIPK